MDDNATILIPIVCSLGFFAMVVIIVITAARSKQRQAQYQAEVQTKLIDRFNTAPELIEFLRSPSGKEFMGSVEAMPRTLASDRVLTGLRKAVTLTVLGVAFLFLCFFEDYRNEGFMIAGSILTALGVGYFVSTYLSLKLSKSWGLIGNASAQEPSRGFESNNVQ